MPRIATTTTGQTNLDAPITSRADATYYTAARGVLLSNLDATMSSRQARVTTATYQDDTITTSPAGDAVIADTGALAAGEYEVICTGYIEVGSATNSAMWLQHRNAANTTTTRQFRMDSNNQSVGAVGAMIYWRRVSIAVGERIRLFNGVAATGASGSSAGSGYWVSSLQVRTV